MRLSETPEYNAWKQARMRCQNPRNARFKDYGGRGITVCERWQKYENFLSDMGPRPSPLHSLDRENNDGNYEPGNCRWATAEQQQRNMRNNNWITAFGETLCLQDWVRRTGLDSKTIRWRIATGWTPEDALSTSPGSRYAGQATKKSLEEVLA
jgi:hypothetical protein